MQKNVGTFQISMKNFDVMERFQAANNLNKYLPDFIFLNVLLILLMGCDLLKQIAVVRILHYDTIIRI